MIPCLAPKWRPQICFFAQMALAAMQVLTCVQSASAQNYAVWSYPHRLESGKEYTVVVIEPTGEAPIRGRTRILYRHRFLPHGALTPKAWAEIAESDQAIRKRGNWFTLKQPELERLEPEIQARENAIARDLLGRAHRQTIAWYREFYHKRLRNQPERWRKMEAKFDRMQELESPFEIGGGKVIVIEGNDPSKIVGTLGAAYEDANGYLPLDRTVPAGEDFHPVVPVLEKRLFPFFNGPRAIDDHKPVIDVRLSQSRVEIKSYGKAPGAEENIFPLMLLTMELKGLTLKTKSVSRERIPQSVFDGTGKFASWNLVSNANWEYDLSPYQYQAYCHPDLARMYLSQWGFKPDSEMQSHFPGTGKDPDQDVYLKMDRMDWTDFISKVLADKEFKKFKESFDGLHTGDWHPDHAWLEQSLQRLCGPDGVKQVADSVSPP